MRPSWADLSGGWDFGYDDTFGRTIVVPFPPESPASKVGDTGFHPVVWYRREITANDLRAAGRGEQGDRVILHFGAVDFIADAWLDGQYLGRHVGGQTPFSFDITDLVGPGKSGVLVVRAEDDPHDVSQPRGKQDWQAEPHDIWYHRTTGIWQPVWLEAVPEVAITELAWIPDLPGASVRLDVALSRRPSEPVDVDVQITHLGDVLANERIRMDGPRASMTVSLPRQRNGQASWRLLWSPERPTLLDATVTLSPSGDQVGSYLGLRSAAVDSGHFLLNDRPYFVRSVLEQGYWPASHLAAPSADALRAEVQLIKDLGFNAARIHQKAEDPRFLYWADRLGLLIWGETANAFEFSPTAVRWLTQEWAEIVRRDISHPSIVTWVPLNESWGVQHIAHDPAQAAYAASLAQLTRALDGSRPVVSNDGWEHVDSDIWTVHDYSRTGAALAARYSSTDFLNGIGPSGRRMRLPGAPDRGQPVMVTEFGGVSYASTHDGESWGYLTATTAEEYEARLRELFAALHGSPVLAGFCYTQLTDTRQETNGLLRPDRTPKLDIAVIRSIVTGSPVPGAS